MTFVSFSALQTNKATPAALSSSAQQQNQSVQKQRRCYYPLDLCSYFIIYKGIQLCGMKIYFSWLSCNAEFCYEKCSQKLSFLGTFPTPNTDMFYWHVLTYSTLSGSPFSQKVSTVKTVSHWSMAQIGVSEFTKDERIYSTPTSGSTDSFHSNTALF